MDQDAKGSVTKRRYERVILVDCPVEVYRLRAIALLNSRTNIGSRLINLSEVGVQVSVTQRLEPDARIRIVSKIPKVAETIEGEFAVRWCATNMHVPGEFYVGAEFTTMPPGQVAKIQQLRKFYRSAQFKQKQATQVRENREAHAHEQIQIVDNPTQKP